MARKLSRDSKVLLSIFGPIAVLFIVLIFFQYKTFKVNRDRIQEQLFTQQDLITTLAANRMQTHVREIFLKLDHLAGIIANTRESAAQSEAVSAVFDTLYERVDGIAYFDASGHKVHTVSKKGAMQSLPNDSHFEEYFSIPKLTSVSYISPVTKQPGGREVVYVSCPIRTRDTGAFAGIILAQVGRSSITAICSSLEELKGDVSFCYYDQLGQRLCTSPFCDLETGPDFKELMAGGVKASVISYAKKGGPKIPGGAARVLFDPVQVEGYKWYVSSVMPLSGMRAMARGDFLFLLGVGGFFIVSLAGGGFYFMTVYRAKAQAEAEAAYQASLAAQGEALAAEKDKLLAVLNSIPDGIMLFDKDGKIVDANAKVRDILGVSPNGRLTEDIEKLPDGFPLKALLGPADGMGESVIGNKTYKLVTVPVADTGQTHLKEVRLLRDVTLEKSLSQKKSDLVSMITHDVKSPLTAIIGISQWIGREVSDKGLDEDIKSGLEAIGRAANRILSLMENFLFLSSIEGMRKLHRKQVNLNVFLNKAILEFYLEAKQKNIKLDCRIAEPSPVISMDETQMMRALVNLINNALKYTPEGGEVSVSAKNFRNYVTISISDNGPGISKTDLPFIFDRYFRARTAKKGAKGSGLGLAITKAVVEAHGGTIDVASEEGRGATFTVRLPLFQSSDNN